MATSFPTIAVRWQRLTPSHCPGMHVLARERGRCSHHPHPPLLLYRSERCRAFVALPDSPARTLWKVYNFSRAARLSLCTTLPSILHVVHSLIARLLLASSSSYNCSGTPARVLKVAVAVEISVHNPRKRTNIKTVTLL